MTWKEGGTMRTRRLLSAVAAQLSAAGPWSAAPPSPLSHTQNETKRHQGCQSHNQKRTGIFTEYIQLDIYQHVFQSFTGRVYLQCKLRQTCIFNGITANRDLSIIKLYSLLATPHPQTKPRVNLCKYNPGYTYTCQMRKKL